ncbi:MAG TPA: hypothetical protein VE442_11460 [Jatrophihabitans sp.]|nr:hypothetical protein [Jatrophihabitans sp.]
MVERGRPARQHAASMHPGGVHHELAARSDQLGEQRVIGQPGRLRRRPGRHARLQGVLTSPGVDAGEQRGAPLPPATRVDQPVAGCDRAGRHTAHLNTGRHQLAVAHRSAAAHLADRIRRAADLGQLGRPLPSGAAPTQGGREGVQHPRTCGDALLARVAQHQSLPDVDGQRRGEEKPRQVVGQRTHPHRHRGRADVQREPRRQQVGGAGEPHVQHRHVTPRARRRQRVAAAHLIRLDAAQVHRDAGDRIRRVDPPVERLERSDARLCAGRADLDLVADAQRARPERAGHHGAGATDGEHAIDPQPGRPRCRCRQLRRHAGQSGTKRVHADVRDRADRHCLDVGEWRPGEVLARLRLGQLRIAEVGAANG